MSECIEHTQKGRGMGYGSTRWLGVLIMVVLYLPSVLKYPPL